jgi:hypothetical protein
MLTVAQRFGKHCICHLQGGCVDAGSFWKLYTGEAVGAEEDVMALIGGANRLDSSTLLRDVS